VARARFPYCIWYIGNTEPTWTVYAFTVLSSTTTLGSPVNSGVLIRGPLNRQVCWPSFIATPMTSNNSWSDRGSQVTRPAASPFGPPSVGWKPTSA
jgi:hypothetical protein